MPSAPETRKRPRLGRIGRTRLLIFLAVMGPGLIAAASDNDAGGITTWSVIGARYGYSLLWLLLLITPILAVTQEMGARMGVVTGKGLAALIRERFSLKITAFAMLALLVANFGTTVAEFSGIAAAFGLAHVPPWAVRAAGRGGRLAAGHAGIVPSRGARLPGAHGHLRGLRAGRVSSRIRTGAPPRAAPSCPSFQSDSAWLLIAIAAIGTTITPWGQFFIQAYVVDKKVAVKEYIYTKLEVYAGAVFTDAIDLFIVVACAATLYKHGILVDTAQDAAQSARTAGGTCGLPALRLRAAERVDPRRGHPAADDGLRDLGGVRLRVGARPVVRRRADLQRPAHVLHLRAGRRRHHPAPAARQGDPAEPGRERHPAAHHPDLRAQDRERPLGHGRLRERPGLQHGGLGLLDRADRPHRRAARLALPLGIKL